MKALPTIPFTYTTTTYSNWSNVNHKIEQRNIEAKHLFIGFKLRVIPYFDNELNAKNQSAYTNAIGRQKNFLETVKRTLLDARKDLRCIIDLRLQNDFKTRTLHAYLILRIIPDTTSYYNSENIKRDFKALIPMDYELIPMDDGQIASILALNCRKVIELRKSLSFPKVGSFFYEESSGIPPRSLSDWDEKTRYQLPMSNYLEPHTYNMVSLYQHLQNIKEQVQIRISLASTKIFEFEKNLAQQYFYMMHKSYKDIKNPTIENGLKAYSKYLAQSSLYTMKIQVAASNEFTGMAIANVFGGQLTHGEAGTRNVLVPSFLQGCNQKEIRDDWENCNHFFYSNPAEPIKGTSDANIKSFITRLPYLCDSLEAISVFRLPIATSMGIPGMVAKQRKPFYMPNLNIQKGKQIKLGNVITSNRSEDADGLKYGIPIKDLTKHGLIVGATGSGKTNTTLNFVKQLLENEIPFLIIEPVKSEYHDEIKSLIKDGKINRFNFENPWLDNGDCNPEYLRFNPLIPMEGISITQHISFIKGCFNAAFPMHGVVPLVLEECLYELYETTIGDEKMMFDKTHPVQYRHDLDAKDLSEELLELRDLLDIDGLNKMITMYLGNEELFTADDQKDFGNYLRRRFEKINKGTMGNAFCPDLWLNRNSEPQSIPNNLLKAFTEPTIIELEALADNEEKSLVMALLLTYLFEFRQTKPSLKELELADSENFDPAEHIHISIIEEAHRLLGSHNAGSQVSGSEDGIVTQGSQSKSIELFMDMLAEIREKGEGIFIVEQSPTKLVSDVIKNCNVKIMHRVSAKDDRDYLGSAMNMNDEQKRFVNNLKTGEATVFAEELDHPIFVKIDRFIP